MSDQLSVFEVFRCGVGPSSSHTVGPMRAAALFAAELAGSAARARCARISVELCGSLGATGRGHMSDAAIIAGLQGAIPETVAPDTVRRAVAQVAAAGALQLAGGAPVAFDPGTDIVFAPRVSRGGHPNAMLFGAHDAAGQVLLERLYLSVGGGFVVRGAADAGGDARVSGGPASGGQVAGGPASGGPLQGMDVPYPFSSCARLLSWCETGGGSIAQVMAANEAMAASPEEIEQRLVGIWAEMEACITAGLAASGTLPGRLHVRRRARALAQALTEKGDDPLVALDWVSAYAMAVNEENAAGGRVVTAPTNGAAGVVPAVLQYYLSFVPGAQRSRVAEFLLTAGAVAILIKSSASIAGAEVGCQGEVGSACAMAAAGLAAVMGGSPRQVENAAEIAMEHNLGLTCDPVDGLVQVPCIERNAIGAIKAITAARIALRGNGSHTVSLDAVIATMRQTGHDMLAKYKETSTGGLAVNIVEC